VAGDGQELGALEAWYGRNGVRTPEAPLLIGSVKSNMGHCEGCSGLAGGCTCPDCPPRHPPGACRVLHEPTVLCCAGLIKLLLSFEHGILPANLHFQQPNPQSAGLLTGTLKVCAPGNASCLVCAGQML
jgi:fatty acid synthase